MSIQAPWLICGLFLAATDPILLRNEETALAFAELEVALEDHLRRNTYPGPTPELPSLPPALEALQRTLERDASARLNRTGSQAIELEAKSRTLFQPPPTLPPENKRDGNWSFETVRFEAATKNLFIFGLTFKSTRTIRLKSVTLVFQEGTRVTHDAWALLENGNGKAFPKRIYLPQMAAFTRDEPRQARALKAVEIVGSAQDGGFAADLDFRFEVPDADETPYRKALRLVSKWKRTWRLDAPTAREVNRYLAEMETLKGLLAAAEGASP